MRASDRAQFVDLLTDALGFYGQTVSPFAVSVWWQACDRFELEQVAKALTGHAMDPDRGQWAPKPADIVRQLQGTHTDRSLIAWGKVLDAMQRVGAYSSVVFDDGAIHAAISDLGGWTTVCRTGVDEMPFLQRRFCEGHKAYSLRPDFPYPARLIGEFEAINRQNGKKVAPPALIGDAERARQVEQLGAAGSRTMITSGSVSIDHALASLKLGADRAA